MSDLVVDNTTLRAELRFVSTISGAQLVLTFGQPVMEMWSADNLDSLQLVNRYVYTHNYSMSVSLTRKLHHEFAGAVVDSSAAFGQGIGPVWLDNVHCSGIESRLVDCPSRRINFHNCYYSNVAGVTCQGKVYWNCYLTILLSTKFVAKTEICK